MNRDKIIDFKDRILVTGANGFIGSRVVEALLKYGFTNVRCFVRPTSNRNSINNFCEAFPTANIEIIEGNLLSMDDCRRATEGASLIIHLAAGIEKTFPGSFLNSVVTTRNLLESVLINGNRLKRFVNVSSFAVYSNENIRRGGLLDEKCAVENEPVKRYEPYVYAKIRQDDFVNEFCQQKHIPYVIVRPGAVYGPGKTALTARVGIDTFGLFFHLGGSNKIPLTYVDNCADAIVLAGIIKGVEGEVFNIVDDDLPTSRAFLKLYKKQARHFKSIYIPYVIFYVLSFLWEKYAEWSKGQLPPVFNRRRCSAYWKGNRYSNEKLKRLLGWLPRVPFMEASSRYFEYVKDQGK